MFDETKNIAIFGIGGLAKDVFYCIKDLQKANRIKATLKIVFFDKDENIGSEFLGCLLLNDAQFNPELYQVVIAIGNTRIRKAIAERLPEKTVFPNVIHPTANINETVLLERGIVILQNVLVSCDVSIGEFSILDRAVNIGHDCKLSNYVHISPLVALSGNVTIGQLVEIGTQAGIKENTTISPNTIIGMGAIVVKSIIESGTYVGVPAKRIHTQ